MVTTKNFPVCCSAQILTDFYAKYEEGKKVGENRMVGEIKGLVKGSDHTLWIAITNSLNQKSGEAALRRARFKVLKMWTGTHGERLKLWGRVGKR